jgi:four helix bundle protein
VREKARTAQERQLPKGANCPTARTAQEREVPNGDNGANIERRELPNGASCQTAQLPNGASCQTAQLPNGATAKRRNCQTAQLPNGATAKRRRERTGLPKRQEDGWPGATSPHPPVVPHRDLDVLDAAERAADAINSLIDRSHRRLLHVRQLRDAAQAIPANISEGFGRRKGRDRARSLEIARGETEESISHLASNFRAQRIEPKEYWKIRNLLVVIVKMLSSLLSR